MTEEKQNPFNKTYEQHIAEILKKQKQNNETATEEAENNDKESE